MSGIINDTELKQLISCGKLICEGAEITSIKQACYELRVGNVYYDLSSNAKRVEIDDDGYVLLKPHQRVVIVTKEKLELPKNFLAHIITKGALTSIGLSPVSTYADPGFFGRLGLVVQNISNEYIVIKSGEAIAKIEFNKLEKGVEKPYRGQHGYETGIWPIRDDMIVDRKDINKFLQNYEELDEIEYAFGKPVASIIKRIIVAERQMILSTVVFIIIDLVLVGISAGEKWTNPVASVIIGIIVNILYGLLTMLFTRKR